MELQFKISTITFKIHPLVWNLLPKKYTYKKYTGAVGFIKYSFLCFQLMLDDETEDSGKTTSYPNIKVNLNKK